MRHIFFVLFQVHCGGEKLPHCPNDYELDWNSVIYLASVTSKKLLNFKSEFKKKIIALIQAVSDMFKITYAASPLHSCQL